VLKNKREVPPKFTKFWGKFPCQLIWGREVPFIHGEVPFVHGLDGGSSLCSWAWWGKFPLFIALMGEVPFVHGPEWGSSLCSWADGVVLFVRAWWGSSLFTGNPAFTVSWESLTV
jgi:hypothetical protein